MTASSAPRPMSERTRPTLSRGTKMSSPPIAISTTTNIPFRAYAPADRTPTAKGSDLARDDHLGLIAQDRPDHAERRSLPSPAPATLLTEAPATSRAHAPLQDGSITPNEAMSRSSDREASALLGWTSQSGPAARARSLSHCANRSSRRRATDVLVFDATGTSSTPLAPRRSLHAIAQAGHELLAS